MSDAGLKSIEEGMAAARAWEVQEEQASEKAWAAEPSEPPRDVCRAMHLYGFAEQPKSTLVMPARLSVAESRTPGEFKIAIQTNAGGASMMLNLQTFEQLARVVEELARPSPADMQLRENRIRELAIDRERKTFTLERERLRKEIELLRGELTEARTPFRSGSNQVERPAGSGGTRILDRGDRDPRIPPGLPPEAGQLDPVGVARTADPRALIGRRAYGVEGDDSVAAAGALGGEARDGGGL